MNRTNLLKLLGGTIAAVWTLQASANGFCLADQDAFAMARGEAFVATADNPSAIYYNPAGITQLQGGNLRGGLYGIYLDPSYRPPATALNAGQVYYDENNFAAAPQFFGTYTPEDCPLSFGFGVYAPFGGNIKWPDDTGFRTVATQGSLTYLTINPVVAIKPLSTLSFGAGLMANYANLDFQQGLRPNTRFPNFYKFDGEGWSFGYNLGVLWQPIEQLSFGASFRSSADVTFKGQAEYELFTAGVAQSSIPAQMNLTFPLEVVGGLSYRPTPKWNLEFDADYTDWSSFGKTAINQPEIPPLVGPTPSPVTFDWQASWMFEFGATRYLAKGWHVSAGYVFSENSVPDSYYTPLAADLDRHFISVGAGHKGRHLDFDVAYQFGYGPGNTVTGSQPSSPIGASTTRHPADGTYDFISHAVLVTLGWHF